MVTVTFAQKSVTIVWLAIKMITNQNLCVTVRWYLDILSTYHFSVGLKKVVSYAFRNPPLFTVA